MDGTVSINSDVTDKTIISYALDSNYNFSVISADEGEINISMNGGGTFHSADIYWFNFDTCFLAGTKVVMADGSYKNIEDIVVGDLVLAYDEGTGAIANCKVTHTFYHSPEEMTEYYLLVNDNLQVTPNHRFYSDGEWVYAGDLEVGDSLLTKELSESYAVSSLEKIYEKVPTYDLEIENLHTFFVSIDEGIDILVHNLGDGAGPSNQPPIADDDFFTVAENSENNILDVLANDDDEDGYIAGFTITSNPTYGTIAIKGELCCPYSHTLCYTPGPDFLGEDSFTYKIVDNQGAWSNIATVTITVTGVNDPPVANNDSANVVEDSSNNQIDVLSNDTDPDGDTLSIIGVTQPPHGSVSHSTLYVFYTPDANYNGPDQFSYTISDGNGGADSATVYVTVTPVNDPPVANDDSATVVGDSSNNQINVLSNDTDPDGDSLTIESVTNPSNGSASTDGSYVYYTPDANYNGSDQFSYTISDGNGGTDSATVYVTVTPVNNPPVANDDSATVVEDSSNNQIDVLSNDTDPDGDSLTIESVTNPSNGSASTDGSYVYYTPDANYTGPDQFTYTINDGNGGTDSAIVSVTVHGLPILVVSPTRLDYEIRTNSISVKSFVIQNNGTGPLSGVTVTVDVLEPQWCTVEPSGRLDDIGPGGNISINVIINSSDMHPGVYNCNIAVDAGEYGQKTVHIELTVLESSHSGSDKTRSVNLSGNKIEAPDGTSFSGTLVIELLDANGDHFGNIWLFESNSMTYEMSSSVGKTKFVIENGGVIDASSATERVETGPRIANNENIIYLPVTQMVASSGNTLTSGALSKLKANLKGSATNRYDLNNSGVYGLRIQLSGDHTDAWVDFFTEYDFQQEEAQDKSVTLLYEHDGVKLNLWHSYVEVALDL